MNNKNSNNTPGDDDKYKSVAISKSEIGSSIQQIALNSQVLVDYITNSLQLVQTTNLFNNPDLNIARGFALGVQSLAEQMVKARADMRECCLLAFRILKYPPSDWDQPDESANSNSKSKQRLWTVVNNGCSSIIECAMQVFEQTNEYLHYLKKIENSLQYFYELRTNNKLQKAKEQKTKKKKKKKKRRKQILVSKKKSEFPLHLCMREFSQIIISFVDFSQECERQIKDLQQRTTDALTQCWACTNGDNRISELMKSASQNEDKYMCAVQDLRVIYENRQEEITPIVNSIMAKEAKYFRLKMGLQSESQDNSFSLQHWKNLHDSMNLLNIKGDRKLDSVVQSLKPYIQDTFDLNVCMDDELTEEQQQMIDSNDIQQVNNALTGLSGQIRNEEEQLKTATKKWDALLDGHQKNMIKAQSDNDVTYAKLRTLLNDTGLSAGIAADFFVLLQKLLTKSTNALESGIIFHAQMDAFYHLLQARCLISCTIREKLSTNQVLAKFSSPLEKENFVYLQDLVCSNEAEFKKYVLPSLLQICRELDLSERKQRKAITLFKKMCLSDIAEEIESKTEAVLPQVPVIVVFLDRIYNVLQFAVDVYLRSTNCDKTQQEMAQIRLNLEDKKWIQNDVALPAIEYVGEDQKGPDESKYNECAGEGDSDSHSIKSKLKELVKNKYLLKSIDDKDMMSCLTVDLKTILIKLQGESYLKKFTRTALQIGEQLKKDVYVHVTEKHYSRASSVEYDVTDVQLSN